MNVFWRTHYHLVWTTKNRSPLITPEREQILYGYIQGKADAIGCIVQAIGGINDHIHLVISIPPTLSVADSVKQLKGSSAYHLNHSQTGEWFGWQRGYGVLTVGSRQCDRAIAYVLNQKEHHQEKSTIAALECEGFRD